MGFSNWKIDHFRLTTFQAEELALEASQIFERVFEGSPAEIRIKPSTGESFASGEHCGHQVEIQKSLVRVDIIFRPTIPKDAVLEILSFSNPIEAIELFEKICTAWLRLPEFNWNRVAVGSLGLLPQESVSQAYSSAQTYMDGVIKVLRPDVSELIVNYNDKILSDAVPGLLLNRISNVKTLIIQKALDTFSNAVYQRNLPEEYFLNLTLDYNSAVAQERDLSSADAVDVFSELLSSIKASFEKVD